MRVAVFGLGHVGLVTALMLTRYGHCVYGVDVDKDRLSLLRMGRLPFREQGLEPLLLTALGDDLLHLSENGAQAVAESDFSLVCVPTPVSIGGQVDLQAVYAVLDEISKGLLMRSGYHVVALRSTIPPGVVGNLRGRVEQQVEGRSWGFCTFPEFLREGTAVDDFRHPPLLVIGQYDARAGGHLMALFHKIKTKKIVTDCAAAMLLKYVCNAWHALKVTFANEVGDIAVSLGVNGDDLMEVFIQDTVLNISPAYLRPGAPFGGSCLPKDLRALVYMTAASTPLLASICVSNTRRIRRIMQRAVDTGANRFGVVGLSFKSGTDDLRESPWVQLVELLLADGNTEVRVYDPDVSVGYGGLRVEDFEELVSWAECLVIGKPELVPSNVTLPKWVVYGDRG